MQRIVHTTLRPYENLSLFFCEDPFINKGDFVIVEGKHGLTLTQVTAILKDLPNTHEDSNTTTIIRKATGEDLNTYHNNKLKAKEAYNFCKSCLHKHNLEMKLIDVELTFDSSKLIFYYTAPIRVDFRDLVKNLVQEYHIRIELRQINERNELQILGALGNCGMVCCCRRFLKKFTPVSIKMAKEQNILLNPTKIAGQCGKLLCCLSYEQENYHDFHQKTPSIGKKYKTDQGIMKILRTNIFQNTITVLDQEHKEIDFTPNIWSKINPNLIEQTYKKQIKEQKNSLIKDEHTLTIEKV